MKVSKETSARHREALLAAASRLFREKGFDKVGIAEIAAAADLTHGAFYTHFASKDDLCAAAINRAMSRSLAALAASGDWQAYVTGYLDPKHVRSRGAGCPLAALGGDVPRESPEIRGVFADGLERYIAATAETLGENGAPAARDRAIHAIAALLGGLILARNAADGELRDEILAAVKAELLGARVAG
jgi:TetR/AcrR family transcriptional regulator, transcriptional repressor for nem operon